MADLAPGTFLHDGILVCQKVLQQKVISVDFPGGEDRKSFRAKLDDRSVILTKRKKNWRAEKEARALEHLSALGAPVPAILGYDGEWLIQQELPGIRLSEALAVADAKRGEKLLDGAITTLADIQTLANENEFLAGGASLGATEEWLTKLIETPKRLGDYYDIPAPALELKPLIVVLRDRHQQFVKWDARPANAMVDDGQVAWFDWEHCGRRNPLDDLAWLLGDEYVPLSAEVEDRLLARHLPRFEPDLEEDGATYVRTMGTFHVSYRLSLILSKKKSDPWWPEEACLAHDRVGVFEEAFRRLCQRGHRWAAQSPLTEPLADWFKKIDGLA